MMLSRHASRKHCDLDIMQAACEDARVGSAEMRVVERNVGKGEF